MECDHRDHHADRAYTHLCVLLLWNLEYIADLRRPQKRSSTPCTDELSAYARMAKSRKESCRQSCAQSRAVSGGQQDMNVKSNSTSFG